MKRVVLVFTVIVIVFSSMALAASLDAQINAKLGKWNVVEDMDRLMNTELATLDDGSNLLIINMLVNDNLTQNMIKTGALIDMWDLIPIAFNSERNADQVGFNLFFVVQDNYGNNSIGRVGILLLQRSEYNKVNMNNFTYSMLPNISQFMWNINGLNL